MLSASPVFLNPMQLWLSLVVVIVAAHWNLVFPKDTGMTEFGLIIAAV